MDSLREAPATRQLSENVRGYIGSAEFKAAIGAAFIGTGATLAAGLILALFIPNTSLLNITRGAEEFGLKELSLLREILIFATGASLAGLEASSSGGGEEAQTYYPFPVLLALAPLVGIALGVRGAFRGIASHLSTGGYIAATASVALCFAGLMAVLVLLGAEWKLESTSDTETATIGPPLLAVFLLSLLWGAVGAVAGLAVSLRRDNVTLRQRLPVTLSRAIYRGTPAATSLALLLAITSLIGTTVWTVQSIRDAADARLERSLPASIFDSVIYSGDLGIRYAALGSLADFELSSGLLYSSNALSPQTPIPITRGTALQLDFSEPNRGRDRLRELNENGVGIEGGNLPTFDLFSFQDLLDSAFLPFAVALIGLAGLAALYAGFLTASRANTDSRGMSAAWGALVGPVWAVLILALNALSENAFFGIFLGESVLVSALLGGVVLGALGGVLTSPGATGNSPAVRFPT